MKKALLKKSLICSLVFIISSCVTINIYFPAAAVEKAADRNRKSSRSSRMNRKSRPDRRV